ncbi:hypothetical protein [Ignicoccus hospitalis]|uniref:H/ACA RNA-protein complex component Gar1 n=1 Tax=Ignicoccus hospitalis (strain KIN4/I / DSM 18386 / JCM 14125) TaxID=453591 RepID=A8AAJ9_IGNH4|nr:hypothetical protein [Ignicoccus hospitalis]ABU81951.1 hypothetical protein Igni_0769 [Ignicoccus hospitalis KIN4/I]HIH89890.1 hypothetical protein [Desulfurococcaceae archaeon]
MKFHVYKVTRTGIYVLKLEDKVLPRIGDKIKVDNKIMKVLDIIGPVQEPFVVAKALGETRKSNTTG